MERQDALTTVLERFARSNPELPNGFAEHVPMGAEALLSLGVDPAAVVAWAGQHRPTALPAGSPMAAHRQAIEHELADEAWPNVVQRHVASLVDQLDAHLFHGLIRTAHAVRSLQGVDDQPRRAELAAALASWAAWALVPAGAPQPEADTATTAAPLAVVLDAARRGAGAFAAKPTIFTLHAVTAPMAFLLLAEHVDESIHARAAAAFARTHHGHGQPPTRAGEPTPTPDPAAIARLAQRWDAHPAKLTEAALRGHTLTGDVVFLDAAAAMLAQ